MPCTVERVCRERSRCVRMNLEGPLSAAAPTPTDHGWATPHSSGFRRLGPGSARFPARGPRLPSSRPSRSFVCRLQHRRTISGHPSGLGYQLAHALGPWSTLIYLSPSRVSINGHGLDSGHGGGKYRSMSGTTRTCPCADVDVVVGSSPTRRWHWHRRSRLICMPRRQRS